MTPSPRLTAILTCRNAEPTLDALLTHLAQEGAEIVAIDNGSTDATGDILRSHKAVVEVETDPYLGSQGKRTKIE